MKPTGAAPTLRKCSRCGSEKPLEAFNKRAKAKDGLRSSCKDCDRAVRGAWEAARMAPKAPEEPSKATDSTTEGPEKIIGRIQPVPGAPTGPRIREMAVDPTEEAERAAAKEYSDLLNRKLSVRQRAILMVKIARNIKGGNAALALKALQDINLATGVVSKTGLQVDMGPLFVLPEGSNIKMTG